MINICIIHKSVCCCVLSTAQASLRTFLHPWHMSSLFFDSCFDGQCLLCMAVVPKLFRMAAPLQVARSRFSQGSQCQILRSALCEIATAKDFFLCRDR